MENTFLFSKIPLFTLYKIHFLDTNDCVANLRESCAFCHVILLYVFASAGYEMHVSIITFT